MSRTLTWDDQYCPEGHGDWVFISATTLYSDLYWCPRCDCFYQPQVERLTYEELNKEFVSDRAADLVSRGKFLKWKDSLTLKDMPKDSTNKEEA